MSSISTTHVVIGMSGGVDSSLSAVLLRAQGYKVQGVFMQNWDDDDQLCTARNDYRDALAVCKKIGIQLKTVNFSQEYWDRVFQHFLDEYSSGRTPNPDILCNKEIKFNAFLHYAKSLGADYIATGHYARNKNSTAGYSLLRGTDENKDQTYFLYTLGQEALSQSLFPLGEINKVEVRQLAKQSGLHNFSKKDSTGICFIGERKFSDFLSQYLPSNKGRIISDSGDLMGEHQGLMYYTLGQRQGLGIGGKKNAPEGPWYVIKKNLDSNELIVAQNHQHPALLTNTLTASQQHWTLEKKPTVEFACTAKVRYQQKDVPCHVLVQADNKLTVQFNRQIRAVTPGQAIVFYQEEVCLGGATIDSTRNEKQYNAVIWTPSSKAT